MFIERQLRKFGEIEAIEMCRGSANAAYVTYTNDRNAYLAVAHNELEGRRINRVFNIQPADTWKQPAQQSTECEAIEIDEEFTPAFFTLNEDCILEIFKYVDFDGLVNLSEVCKLFHRLLHSHFFPRYRTFVVENNTSKMTMPLAKMRRSLMCIGPYISELKFWWHDFDHNNRLKRFLDILGQLIGKNIRRVCFRDTVLTDEHIPAIQDMLSRLETLEITVYNPDYDLDLDFGVICPKLRKLKLLENMQLNRICRPWPTLEHLSIVGNEYMVLNTFRSFLSQNPQLKCLKFTAYHADERLQAVAQHLPNVEKLTVLPSFPNLTALNIVYLSSLKNLTKLNLMYLDESDLNDILQCLTRFSALRALKLHLLYDGGESDAHYEPNQQSLIALAQELPHLEVFCTRFIKWKESTVIDFLRSSSQLRALHIHWCDLLMTNSMIWKIVKALQNSRPQPQTVPLKMFVNPSEINGVQMISDPDIVRHLVVNTKCAHSGDVND